MEPEGEDRFITDEPYNLIEAGKVQDLPWIASFTKDEGLFPAAGESNPRYPKDI